MENQKEPQPFIVGLSDGTHGLLDDGSMTSDNLKKGNVKMSLSSNDKIKVELTNNTGALKCSKSNLGTYACTEVTPVKTITGLCVDDSSYAGVEGTIEINPTNFADDDWATIAAAVKSGNYEGKYEVGNTKEVDLGDLGKHTVRIANTKTPADCSQDGFSQTACGFVLEFADIITTHTMNSTDTNVGGWPASSMRSYLSTEIYNALPPDLQGVIVNTKVVSGHGSDDTDNFISTDKLYLLEPKEVYGNNGGTAYSATRQLDYYLAQGVKIGNYSGAIKQRNGSNYWWWLRAAASYNEDYFYRVGSDGSWIDNYTYSTYGVSPAFRIA